MVVGLVKIGRWNIGEDSILSARGSAMNETPDFNKTYFISLYRLHPCSLLYSPFHRCRARI